MRELAGPWLPGAGAALLLALAALLDTPWVRARVGRRTRARLLRAYALARDRHALLPLGPFLHELEESGVAMALGGAISGLGFLAFGLIGEMDERSPGLRLALALPFFLGALLAAASLLRLLLLVPRAFFLWLLRLALGAVEGVGRLLFGPRAAAERRPFTYAALLGLLVVAVVWGVVEAAGRWGGMPG